MPSHKQQRLRVIAEARRELADLNASVSPTFDAEIRARLRGRSGGFLGRSTSNGIPQGSDAEQLLPALEAWRHSTLPLEDYRRLRARLLRILAAHHQDVLRTLSDPDSDESARTLASHGLPAEAVEAARKALAVKVLERWERVEGAVEPGSDAFGKSSEMRGSVIVKSQDVV